MGIPDRVYSLAKGQLENALKRWDQIDAAARQEIDDFLSKHQDTNSMSPWERAQAKINASQAARELDPASSRVDDAAMRPEPSLDELERQMASRPQQPQSLPTSSTQPQTSNQTLVAAYRVLGVEPGADWLTVQTTYNKLKERAAPERFPPGSAERSAAGDIKRRIESAYIMLGNSLAPSTDRFDKLEI